MLRQDAVKTSFAIALENNPQAVTSLQEILKIVQQKDPTAPKGDIITQHHSDSGDNVGGDKIINQK